jgi:O-antigen/teichoic acid export membrane protein
VLSSRHYYWSIGEKSAQRLVSASISLALPFLTSPARVGAYGFAMASLMLLQAGGDVALRQSGAAARDMGTNTLVRLRLHGYVIGGISAVAMVGVLASLSQLGFDRHDAHMLWPLVFVPIAASGHLSQVVLLQRDQRFVSLARRQALAAVLSLPLAVPLLLFGDVLLAAATQSLATEAFVVLLVRGAAVSQPGKLTSSRNWLKISAPPALVNVLANLQPVGDRVLIGLISGPISLGLFSLAYSILRAIADVVIMGIMGVLTPRLAQAESGHRRREWTRSIEIGACLLLGSCVLVNAILWGVGLQATDPTWAPALAAAPIFLLATFPMLLGWSINTHLLVSGQSSRNLVAQLGAGILVLPVAIASTVGMTWTAMAVLIREIVLAGARLCFVPRNQRPGLGVLMVAAIIASSVSGVFILAQ